MSDTPPPAEGAKVLKKEDLGKPQPIASGRPASFVLPGEFLEFIVKDEAGNPYSFLKFELVFKVASGPPREPIQGFLDENGRLFIDPVPAGDYTITIYDSSGAKVRMIDLHDGDAVV
jgi:hypothetical protein